LSHQYDWSNVLVRVAHQQLKLIVNELNETAHLAVREGKNALFIYSAHANHIIAVAGQTGELVLLYCTAHDKALLADADERDLTSQFGSGPLPKYTQRTLSTDVLQLSGLLLVTNCEMITRPAIFKWRQTEPSLILCAVRWYLRYSLSLRDVEELLEERGRDVDHTTVWRWVQCYGPELEQRMRRHLKSTNKSWRVDETYVRVKGRWCYLYRAIDSTGATIDFLLSALRDADAAKRLFRRALSNLSHPQPRVINTDQAPIYSSAISDSKKEGTLRDRCRHRPVQYLNNILEQDQ
jgi:transposase-like protein